MTQPKPNNNTMVNKIDRDASAISVASSSTAQQQSQQSQQQTSKTKARVASPFSRTSRTVASSPTPRSRATSPSPPVTRKQALKQAQQSQAPSLGSSQPVKSPASSRPTIASALANIRSTSAQRAGRKVEPNISSAKKSSSPSDAKRQVVVTTTVPDTSSSGRNSGGSLRILEKDLQKGAKKESSVSSLSQRTTSSTTAATDFTNATNATTATTFNSSLASSSNHEQQQQPYNVNESSTSSSNGKDPSTKKSVPTTGTRGGSTSVKASTPMTKSKSSTSKVAETVISVSTTESHNTTSHGETLASNEGVFRPRTSGLDQSIDSRNTAGLNADAVSPDASSTHVLVTDDDVLKSDAYDQKGHVEYVEQPQQILPRINPDDITGIKHDDKSTSVFPTHDGSIVRIKTSPSSVDFDATKHKVGLASASNNTTNLFVSTSEAKIDKLNQPLSPPPSTKSDSIRARLRNQEQRLTEMMSTRRVAEVEEIVERQMREVRETLEQVEAEKAELEQKLEYLQVRQAEEEAKRLEDEKLNASSPRRRGQQHLPQLEDIQLNQNSEHDEFLRVKLSGIQKGFTEQANKIDSLQDAITRKNYEIDQLQLDLSNRLKQIIELEYDLQSHSIHYTNYSQEQYKLGNDAVNELNELVRREEAELLQQQQLHEQLQDGDRDDLSTIATPLTLPAAPYDPNAPLTIKNSQSNGSTWMTPPSPIARKGMTAASSVGRSSNVNSLQNNPKRAKKLISTLLSDLDHLEELYKNEKLKSIETLSKLQKENEELRSIQIVLEKEKQESSLEDSMVSQFRRKMDSSDINLQNLRKRIDVLEAVRYLYRQEILRLQSDLASNKDKMNRDNVRHEKEVTRLTLALETLRQRCRTLEQDLFGNDDGYHPTLSPRHEIVTDKTVGGDIVSDIENSAVEPSGIPEGLLVITTTKKNMLNSSRFAPAYQIIDCYNEITRLEADLEVKDMQITTLKREMHEVLQKEIVNGNGDPSLYSERDVLVLSKIDDKEHHMRAIVQADNEQRNSLDGKSENDDDDPLCILDSTIKIGSTLTGSVPMSSKAAAAMNKYISDLKKQLHDVRDELAKKEQELVIERAKSSCMAANLLDRIESLDRQLHSSRHNHSNQEFDDDNTNTNHIDDDIPEEVHYDEDKFDEGHEQLDESDNHSTTNGPLGSERRFIRHTDNDDDYDDYDQSNRSGSSIEHLKETRYSNRKMTTNKNQATSGNATEKKERRKIFGRIPLRFYL